MNYSCMLTNVDLDLAHLLCILNLGMLIYSHSLRVLPRTHNITFNASDLKYALWIPDNFMRALSSPNGSYYLFSPDECPGLYNTHGQEFKTIITNI